MKTVVTNSPGPGEFVTPGYTKEKKRPKMARESEKATVVDEPPVYEHVIALATSQSRIQRGTIKVSISERPRAFVCTTRCLGSARNITFLLKKLCCLPVQIRKRTVPVFFENSRLEDYWRQLQQMGPFRQWCVLVLSTSEDLKMTYVVQESVRKPRGGFSHSCIVAGAMNLKMSISRSAASASSQSTSVRMTR